MRNSRSSKSDLPAVSARSGDCATPHRAQPGNRTSVPLVRGGLESVLLAAANQTVQDDENGPITPPTRGIKGGKKGQNS